MTLFVSKIALKRIIVMSMRIRISMDQEDVKLIQIVREKESVKTFNVLVFLTVPKKTFNVQLTKL